jgi:hypothetical protein
MYDTAQSPHTLDEQGFDVDEWQQQQMASGDPTMYQQQQVRVCGSFLPFHAFLGSSAVVPGDRSWVRVRRRQSSSRPTV